MASKKVVGAPKKPAKKVTPRLVDRPSPRKQAEIDAEAAESVIADFAEANNLVGPTDEVMAHVPPGMMALPERRVESASGLLVNVGGVTREPTHDELLEMGRQMVGRIFGNPEVQAALQKEQNPDPRPKPIISGNHCRLCESFEGNDSRGSLYSDSGMCHTYPTPSVVSPEYYCQRFVFDESLRDAEPR